MTDHWGRRRDAAGIQLWSTGRTGVAQRAALVVRAGVADETPETRGWLTLASRVALAASPPQGVRAKVRVGALSTVFTIWGQVEEGLSWLARRLAVADPNVVERVLVAAQARPSRHDAAKGVLLRHELGVHGAGMYGVPKLGIDRYDEETADWFARILFSTGNVACAFDGDIPRLDLGLPVDDRWSPPEPQWPSRPRPAVVEAAANSVAILGILPATHVAEVLAHSLAARTTERLHRTRADQAAAVGRTERIDARRTAVVVTCPGSDAPGFLLQTVQAALRDVAESGARPHEIDAYAAAIGAGVTDPDVRFNALVEAVALDLLGVFPPSPGQGVEDARRVTPIQVAGLADKLRRNHLVAVPEGTPDEYLFGTPRDVPPSVAVPAGGQEYISAHGHTERLVIAGDALYWVSGDRGVEIPVADVAYMLAYADGGRLLASADGFEHAVEPRDWRGGGRLIQQLDRLVPADRSFPRPARAGVVNAPAPEVEPPRGVRSLLGKVSGRTGAP